MTKQFKELTDSQWDAIPARAESVSIRSNAIKCRKKRERWREVPPLSCPIIYQEQCSRANAARIVAKMECNYLYYAVILNEVKNLAMEKVSTLIASRARCLFRRHDSLKWDKCRYFHGN